MSGAFICFFRLGKLNFLCFLGEALSFHHICNPFEHENVIGTDNLDRRSEAMIDLEHESSNPNEIREDQQETLKNVIHKDVSVLLSCLILIIAHLNKKTKL
jgi:hypothetical protein